MINLLLWLLFLLIAVLSVTNATIIVNRIIHVSSGSSVLDVDAPIGIRLRKWFFIIIGLANVLRFVCCVIFVVYYLLNDFSLQFYLPFETVGRDAIFWKLMNSPSLISLLIYSFLADYIGEVYHSLNASEHRKIFRVIWIVINIIFSVIISAWMIYSWFQSNVHFYFQDLLPWNFGLLGIYSVIIALSFLFYSFSVIRFLIKHSYSNPTKIIARLLTLVIVVSLVIVYYATLRIMEFWYYTPDRCASYGEHEFIVILISESLCSLLIILIITNSMSTVETTIRTRLPIRKRMEIGTTTVPTSTNPISATSNVTRPFAMNVRGYQSISQQEGVNGV